MAMARRFAPFRRLLASLRLRPAQAPVKARSKEVEINRIVAAPDVAARIAAKSPAESREQPSPRSSLASDQDLLYRGTPSETGSRSTTTNAVESTQQKEGAPWDVQWKVLLTGLCAIACTLFATMACYSFGGMVSTEAPIEVGGGRPENRTAELPAPKLNVGTRRMKTQEPDNSTLPPIHDPRKYRKQGEGDLDPPIFLWMGTCQTKACQLQSHWLVSMMENQVDPCWETNAFVCDRSQLPLKASSDEVTGGKNNDSTVGEISTAPTTPKIRSGLLAATDGKAQPENDVLQAVCVSYASKPDEGADSVQEFMSQFGFDLATMKDDEGEDPMDRMTQLSLQFGVHTLLRLERRYSLVADPAIPFTVEMDVGEFSSDLFGRRKKVTEENWKPYYNACLERYGPPPGAEREQLVNELIALDKKVGEAFQSEQKKADSPIYQYFALQDAAEKMGASADAWLGSIRNHGASDYDMQTGVMTNANTLLVAGAVLSGNQSFAARKLIAWHLLRSLIAPKQHCLAAFKKALNTVGEKPALDTPTKVCARILHFTASVRGTAMSLLEGNSSISIRRILDVTDIMARMQRTAATIVGGTTGSLYAHTGQPTRSAMFPDFVNAGSRGAPRFFAGVDVIVQGNFVSDWLRRLRAWFALPAVFQAHLERTAVTEATSFGRYLQAPYYYEDGLAAYNYAVLGQIIAHQIAKEMSTETGGANETNWAKFWKERDLLDYRSVYCLFYDANETTTAIGDNSTRAFHRPIEEDMYRAEKLHHIRSSRIAYLTFQGLPFAQRQVLPDLMLSPAQLFLATHCAFSCLRSELGAASDESSSSCMVIFIHSRYIAPVPCEQSKQQAFNPCSYI